MFSMFYTWTPLITADAFTGVTTDLTTTASGILTIAMIVLGVGILVRALSR